MQQEARHRWASSLARHSPISTTIVETLDPFPSQTLNSSSSAFCLPFTMISNGRDRTTEFQTTVKTFASRRVCFVLLFDKWKIMSVCFSEWTRWSPAHSSQSSSTTTSNSSRTTRYFYARSKENRLSSFTNIHEIGTIISDCQAIIVIQ